MKNGELIEKGVAFWDGNSSMPVVYHDGGRCDAGFKGHAGDCVTRSIAIVTGLPYREIYDRLAEGNAAQRQSSRTGKQKRSARNGIYTRRKWFKDYMVELGFEWVTTCRVGEGVQANLIAGILPDGKIIARVTRHYTAVIDGVIHDTHNPQRSTIFNEDGVERLAHRAVYGYWRYTK